jgi:hypothetical protein
MHERLNEHAIESKNDRRPPYDSACYPWQLSNPQGSFSTRQAGTKRWRETAECRRRFRACRRTHRQRQLGERRDSNPRRPAWEIDHRLKIQKIASMASITSDYKLPSSQRLTQMRLLMEHKWGTTTANEVTLNNVS